MYKLTKIFATKISIPNMFVTFGCEFWLSVGLACSFYFYKEAFLSLFKFVALRPPTLCEFAKIMSTFGTFGFVACPAATIFIAQTMNCKLLKAYANQMGENYYKNYFRFSWTTFLHWFALTLCCIFSLFDDDVLTFFTQNYSQFHMLIKALFVFLFCYCFLSTLSLLLYVAVLSVIITEVKESEGMTKNI